MAVPKRCLFRWTLPPNGWWKPNFDASAVGNPRDTGTISLMEALVILCGGMSYVQVALEVLMKMISSPC